MLPPMRVMLSRDSYFGYNKLKKEINPLHFDLEYAKKIGFDDIVVAGLYTYTFVPRYVEELLGKTVLINRVDIKFEAPAFIDTEIVHQGRVTNVSEESGRRTIEMEVWVEDAKGRHLTSSSVVATIG